MKNHHLQVMLHAPHNLPACASISYPGVNITRLSQPANKHYLFVDLNISAQARPGKFIIRSGGQSLIGYELKARSTENGRTRIKGISSADFIYLIMPDRFANGDPSNDRIAGMKDQSLDRSDYFKRHGGDLKGITDHLGYLQDLGVTTLWLTPVVENDMPDRTEHGYAATDHYTIEPRLGGAAAYHTLIDSLHNRGMKIIQDAVYNHFGIEHFLFRDLPDSSFFHFWPSYTNTNYKDQTQMDPYASAIDKKIMTDGWFTTSMPDVNQNNPYMANFLIQQAVWSTEEFGVDGWRIDTYPYNDLGFMNRCNQALLNEYPQIHLYGEAWVHGVVNESYFTRNIYEGIFKSNLPGIVDFQMNIYGIVPAVTQPFGWTEGVNRLYLTASNDFVYRDPMKNVIFLDNHDMSRFFSVVGEDMQKMKMGLAWLLTYRGIPQLYYGTEILMKNFSNPDGLVRLDFAGGWPGDPSNKFNAAGRTAAEQEIFNYARTLANFRKNSSAIKTGRMMQYVPEDGVYVYFRYDRQQTVMCIMNQNDQEKQLNTKRFSERLNGFSKAKVVADGTVIELGSTLKAPAKTTLVLELQR